MVEFLPVPQPNAQAADAAVVALGTNPRGVSFGPLRHVSAWMAGCQDSVPARPPQRARLIVFAGENRVAHNNLSAFAPEAFSQQLQQLEDGVSPAASLAARHGVGINVVHCASSAPIDKENALSPEELDAAIALGRNIADREIDSGADLLIPGDLGVGNSTVAAALMGRVSATEPVAIIGPGSGVTDELWKNKVSCIRDAMFRARNLHLPLELLLTIGGHTAAALTGFIAQAAARKTPVLIDSPLTATAAALAERLAPGTALWLLAASVTKEPAHALALEDLGIEPLLDIGVNTGQGVGALLALGLICDGLEITAEEIVACQQNS